MLVIVTVGRATNAERDPERLKSQGVEFVRVNMSHSTIDDIEGRCHDTQACRDRGSLR